MISDNYEPLKILGNNLTVQYSGTWNIISPDYLVVLLEDAVTGVQTPYSSYTLLDGWDASSFTIEVNAPLTSAYYIVIARDVEIDQGNPYRTSKGFQGDVVEASFDKITAICQDLRDRLDRTPTLPIGSGASSISYGEINDRGVIYWDGTVLKSDFVTIDVLVDSANIAVAAASSAAASQAASAINESNSASNAASAEASALAAAAAAASGLYNNVIEITAANSPYVPAKIQEGTLFRCDTSAGNIVINFSALSVYGEDMKYAFVKVDGSANTVTVNRGGTDTIDGGTSKVQPDQWTVIAYVGDDASGQWISITQAANIPDNSVSPAKLIKNASLFDLSGSLSTALTTEVALASGGTTNLGAAGNGNVKNITGTTTITSFGSSASTASPLYFLRFSAALTLTHNATTLILPGGANIVTAAGDNAVMKYEGSGNWRCISYTKANGQAIVISGGTTKFTSSGQTIGTTILTIPHGLGQEPDFIASYLQCTVADQGFSVGAKVWWFGVDDNGTNQGNSLEFDATNVYVIPTAGYLTARRSTPGSAGAITNTSWQLYVRAFKFN